jgi:hypothetical protein
MPTVCHALVLQRTQTARTEVLALLPERELGVPCSGELDAAGERRPLVAQRDRGLRKWLRCRGRRMVRLEGGRCCPVGIAADTAGGRLSGPGRLPHCPSAPCRDRGCPLRQGFRYCGCPEGMSGVRAGRYPRAGRTLMYVRGCADLVG